MSIRIACPSCHKVYNLSETTQGKTLCCRECQSAIPVPALAGQGGREDDRRSSDDRLTPPTRRDEEDEPRRRPTERRSRRKESGGGTKLWPILLGIGAVGLVLVGLIITGVALVTLGKSRSSSPAPGGSLEGDLAAMTGVWQSSPVTTGDGKTRYTIKVIISPTAATEGRINLEFATRQFSNTPSSPGTPFSLQQSGNERLLLTPLDPRRRRDILLVYRFEGDQLVLTGKVAAGSVSFPLNNVALRRLSADPAAAIAGNPESAQ